MNLGNDDDDDETLIMKEMRKKQFEAWTGLTIMCPENLHDKSLFLQGILSGMKSSHFLFQVTRCDPATRQAGELPCRTTEEIDEYIRDLEIDTEVM
jgi:hypothetical protein